MWMSSFHFFLLFCNINHSEILITMLNLLFISQDKHFCCSSCDENYFSSLQTNKKQLILLLLFDILIKIRWEHFMTLLLIWLMVSNTKKWIRNITIIMIIFEGEKPQKSLKWIILFSLKANEPSNLQTNKKSTFIEINNVNYICLGHGH